MQNNTCWLALRIIRQMLCLRSAVGVQVSRCLPLTSTITPGGASWRLQELLAFLLLRMPMPNWCALRGRSLRGWNGPVQSARDIFRRLCSIASGHTQNMFQELRPQETILGMELRTHLQNHKVFGPGSGPSGLQFRISGDKHQASTNIGLSKWMIVQCHIAGGVLMQILSQSRRMQTRGSLPIPDILPCPEFFGNH